MKDVNANGKGKKKKVVVSNGIRVSLLNYIIIFLPKEIVSILVENSKNGETWNALFSLKHDLL